MVEQLLTELKISADLKNIHLQNRIQSDVLLWADPHMIQAILRNLLSNAIKFSPKSTAIQINAIASRTHCTIRICDEGQGMSSAVFEQILAQKENLLVSQHTSSLKGSGLGMLICADFIERQNGTFHFEPQKPHGSAFLVSLPQPPIDTANTTEKMEQHPIGQGQANLHFP